MELPVEGLPCKLPLWGRGALVVTPPRAVVRSDSRAPGTVLKP
jgi:hypothetical protein